MGLGDFLGGIKDAGVNLAKGVAYVADPRHLDDIAEGASNAAGFVMDHPGQAWDTAFEVGRAVVKDQMDPVNLAINAGLLAATVATGGAAAPAFMAKLGMGAKSLEAGIAGAKAVETVAEGAKVANTVSKTAELAGAASKAVEATSTAAKVAETGAEVGNAARAGGRIANFAQDVKNTSSAFREAQGLEKLDKGLNMVTELKGAGREALGMSRYGMMTGKRAEAGAQLLDKTADMGRFGEGLGKFAAKKVAGEGNPLAHPGTFNTLDKMRHRYNQVQHVLDAPDQARKVGEGVEIAADPTKAVESQVRKQINAQANVADYVDRGQTASSLYGDTGGQLSTPDSSSWTSSTSSSPVSKSQLASSMYANAPATGVGRTTDLNEQGAPASFAPEIPKSGMYAQSTGQQPIGSAFPSLTGPGPTTSAQPIGAVGPGKAQTGVIDTGSSNQGFQFPEISQPSLSPMYSQGSRTSRRNSGNLVGI